MNSENVTSSVVLWLCLVMNLAPSSIGTIAFAKCGVMVYPSSASEPHWSLFKVRFFSSTKLRQAWRLWWVWCTNRSTFLWGEGAGSWRILFGEYHVSFHKQQVFAISSCSLAEKMIKMKKWWAMVIYLYWMDIFERRYNGNLFGFQ